MRAESIPAADAVDKVRRRISLNPIDVREYREFLTSHIELAKHISRGVLERDIEFHYPDLSEELIVYCSDGLRSTLTRMHCSKWGILTSAMDGGFQAWKKAYGKILLGIANKITVQQ